MPYTIYLKKNEEKRLLAGHSWVYANEVSRIEGKDKNGSLTCVCSADGRFIGKGYINHASKILVRLFIRGNEEDGEALYEKRISAAWEYRKRLGYENCCRVVFAEADDLPRSSSTNTPTFSSFNSSRSACIRGKSSSAAPSKKSSLPAEFTSVPTLPCARRKDSPWKKASCSEKFPTRSSSRKTDSKWPWTSKTAKRPDTSSTRKKIASPSAATRRAGAFWTAFQTAAALP